MLSNIAIKKNMGHTYKIIARLTSTLTPHKVRIDLMGYTDRIL